ncbi:UDP-N-acetylmuramoyl-L-alanine--D-glutamate ligase [Helicobacter sp. 11S03491-1]|uniref:UDP-N-acetylmuramoyl-L-alanine--D-glutamate ligase n=1 Tax=Helicobacter sp. 11S03491-1 TaxID=1476196 RepID=UPI000BA67A03|nr:UDP-N-acetylmuramoyl-L-alanine--D-glutamate ligase [Helicobacter sp. 11S03491-1]PAF43077.1 UDP-N-acetylmuramoyl-L-alanine--D-glutamate ligase [Helicobacter sp. 11S03491-1]
MKNISIFGYGVTTKPMVEFLNVQGMKCHIFDDKFLCASSDEKGNVFAPSSEFKPQNSKLEIVSPGIPPYHPLVKQAKNLIGEYDYFYNLFSSAYCPQTIWISGTNGKTTTTQMLTLLLLHRGAKSGGNIGTPLAVLYAQKVPLWVLETSSFSIHYIQKAYPKLYILLPVKQDHITWHGSFEDYICDKLKPLTLMSQDTHAIIPKEFHSTKEVKNFLGKIFFYENSMSLSEEIGITAEDIKFKEPFLLDGLLALEASKILFEEIDITLLNSFQIGKYRIEEFRDKQMRLWVDDSKGTNVDATIEALKRYQDKKIFLILGGEDKGAHQNPIFELVQKWDIEIFSIGSNQEKLLKLSQQYGIRFHLCSELENAVKKIKHILGQDGVGLLSPAAASLDQFSSYKQRGDLFKQYVLEDLEENKDKK